jgi:16S rRNA G1207 methylase RsmC
VNTYSIYLADQASKYQLLTLARAMGAEIADVSGCGTGYMVSVRATADQADAINAALEVIA